MYVYCHTTDGRLVPCAGAVLSPYLTLRVFRIWWHGEQKNEGGEPSPVGARASDAVEKRRKDKMLIARMLDMDEPFMTEKVRVTEKVRSN